MTTPTAPPGTAATPALDMAHVLFTDIVAYSKLPMEEQQRLLAELQEIVRHTPSFINANRKHKLIRLPTGDGMALVFFGDPEFPVHCAIELSTALRDHPDIKLRMGIHSGPVYRVADINAARNVAGGGINIAQRVMDCGDAGHILISKAVADVLSHLAAWKHLIHDLGETEVKHGVRVHLFNLYTEQAGNAALPEKLHRAHTASTTLLANARRKRYLIALIAVIALVTLSAAGYEYWRYIHEPVEALTIVLADLDNTTVDPVFDSALQGALANKLELPPIHVVSDKRVAEMLTLMNKPLDQRLTPDIAAEVCVRSGAKAMLQSSITPLEESFLILLKAVGCQNGETLATAQQQPRTRDKVIAALDKAVDELRKKLVRSRRSLAQDTTPPEEAMTPSIDALQAYSEGKKMEMAGNTKNAVSAYKHAIELDPKFALAYNRLGGLYGDLGEIESALRNYTRAYELRNDHANRQGRLDIEAHYYINGTFELNKAVDTLGEWSQSYPQDPYPHVGLGANYAALGQLDKALPEMQQAVHLEPSDSNYGNVMTAYVGLDRLADAQAALNEARRLGIEGSYTRDSSYQLAFLLGNDHDMQDLVRWGRGQSGFEDLFLSHQSDTEAYYGKFAKARITSEQAIASALRAGESETAASWRVFEAIREAEIGDSSRARHAVAQALALKTGKVVNLIAALTLARAGDAASAQKLADGLNRQFPLDTVLQNVFLPTIRASIELDRHHPDQAIEILQGAAPFELGIISGSVSFGNLFPAYIRGEAFLQAGRGPEAAAEFQKLLDHRGIVNYCIIGALAPLQLGRAQALSGDKAAARKSYQTFFALWKTADPELPILKQARAEFARLP